VTLLTVRVVPRSARRSVSLDESGRVVVRVRAAPERGRATAEAARALADALAVAPSSIALRTGGRSRTKVFVVESLAHDDVLMRLRATREP
jgi:uncharacterized protein YggU (UPF0235/DUF167 family)